MNETLIKYLAGLMDADGSLSFVFTKYDKADDAYFLQLRLSLASSDAVDARRFVDQLPTTTGMGAVYRYGKVSQFKAWTVLKRADLERLLPRLIKHMVIKGRHWQWLLDTWRQHRGGSYFSGARRDELRASSKLSRVENAGPVKPKNHPTWAWLAGYLDGDGWYRFTYLKPPHNCWLIQVGAVAHKNDAAVLHFLVQAFGGKVFDHGQSKDVFVWHRSLGARDASFALRFLPNLAKHSRLKRDKIDQIISHHRQRLSASRAADAA